MNFIQINGTSFNPGNAHSVVSINSRSGRPLILVNFYQPLADIVFLFNSEEERDSKFEDIRERQT